MARAKRVKSIAKRKTQTTPRRCKTTKKRTGAAAKTLDGVVNIPPKLVPKKDGKIKKAIKIALGLGAAGTAAYLGHLAYQNPDKVKEKSKEAKEKFDEILTESKVRGKEILDQAKQDANDLITDAAMKTRKFLMDKKPKAKAMKNEALKRLNNFINKKKFPDDKNYKPLAIEGYREPYLSSLSTMPDRPPLNPRTRVDLNRIYNSDKPYIDIDFGGRAASSSYKPGMIGSGLERDVVKDLDIIKDDMNRTNGINIERLRNILDEYQRQAIKIDPFSRSLFERDAMNLMMDASDLEGNRDSASIEKYKRNVERDIESLISTFFKILRP